MVATVNDALQEEDLLGWVRCSLAGYKMPRTIVLLPALPRTPTGKLEIAWVKRTVQQKASG